MRLEDMCGRKVLISWSGGLDSTHTLWAVLAKTEVEVFSHHVRLLLDGRDATLSAQQIRAVREATAWLRANVRDFKLTVSAVDFGETPIEPLIDDSTWYSPHVALAALGGGLAAGDVILTGFNDGYTPDPSPEAHVRAVYLDPGAKGRGVPIVTWISPAPAKAERVAELPAKLAAMTWSCRYPLEVSDGRAVPCTRCRTCKELAPHLPERYGAPADALASGVDHLAGMVRRLDEWPRAGLGPAQAAELDAALARARARLDRARTTLDSA